MSNRSAGKASLPAIVALLEQADPAKHLDSQEWGSSQEGLEIFERIVEESDRAVDPPEPDRNRHLMAAGVGLLAAAAVLIVVLRLADSGRVPIQPYSESEAGATPEPGIPLAPADDVLRLASAGAATQPSLIPEQGQYLYRRMVTAYMTTVARARPVDGPAPQPSPETEQYQNLWSRIDRRTNEHWISPDGSGRSVTTLVGSDFLGTRDLDRCRAQSSPECVPKEGVESLTEFKRGEYSLNSPLGRGGIPLSQVPTDADQLEALIREQTKNFANPDDEMFVIVGDVLRMPMVPQNLRAALYEVAARIPGVKLVGEVTDPLGRHGTAITLATRGQTSPGPGIDPNRRQEIIFDPATGRLLAERTVALAPLDYIDAKAGDVIGFAAYADEAVVESIGQRPAGASG